MDIQSVNFIKVKSGLPTIPEGKKYVRCKVKLKSGREIIAFYSKLFGWTDKNWRQLDVVGWLYDG